jgi:C-terminal processing protease CtpA/Prc
LRIEVRIHKGNDNKKIWITRATLSRRTNMTKVIRFIATISVLSLIVGTILVPTGCSPKGDQPAFHNMETFARLYGYVKYFYPGDEAADVDWNKFAFHGIKQVEKAKNIQELKKILEDLFLPIAPALKLYETGETLAFRKEDITPPDLTGMKVVAWQHYGVGFGNEDTDFKSIRVNRRNILEPSTKQLGYMQLRVDAAPYRGKTLKYKAAVKVEDSKGYLYLVVNHKGRKIGFMDNMYERPIQTGQWKEYEISGPVSTEAVNISFGCYLTGCGQMWVDNFQLYYKDGQDWIPIEIQNPNFESDKDGDVPSKWKIYKRHFLFQVITNTASNGKKSVLIKSTTKPKIITEPVFQEVPEFGEFISKDLGNGLSCIMPIALYGTKTQTYPASSPIAAARWKESINGLTEKDMEEGKYMRYANVVFAWNVFQHFYPYFDESRNQWKKYLTTALESAANDKNKYDFLITLKRMLAGLKDGKASAILEGDKSGLTIFPVYWDLVENQLVVIDIFDKHITDLKKGDIVLEINGKTAEDVIAQEALNLSGATRRWVRSRSIFEILSHTKNSKLQLKVKRGDDVFNVTIRRTMNSHNFFESLRSSEKSKQIEEGIYYLGLDQLLMKDILKMMPRLTKAKAIICDLRSHPMGNHHLICHLLKKDDTSNEWYQVPKVIYPDYEKVTYQKSGWHLKAREPHISARMVFITSENAIGYTETFLRFIDYYKLGTIVGQPTAGTDGSGNPFVLPGGYTIHWTQTKVVNHDGTPHYGIGVKPHVLVNRTIEGVKEGRDEFLEEAIRIAKESGK